MMPPTLRRRFAVSTLLFAALAGCAPGPARVAALDDRAAADSALVGRILLAEDRRDSLDASLAAGRASDEAGIRRLAGRAIGRIRDPRYASRDSLAPVPPLVTWPEPAWRLRYRAVTPRADCGTLHAALADSAWPVRLRAMDVMTPACVADDDVAQLRRDVDALPADASRRAPGGVSWHAAAHALVALARLRPDDAHPRARMLASHAQWQARMYAARAATVLGDSALLRMLARDANDDVAEAALDGLAKVTPTDTAAFLAALRSSGPQVVRAAAVALRGSTSPGVARVASAAFERWVAHANASERDVRLALLAAAGRPASDDRPPAPEHVLPPDAVALALGADVRIRVRMAAASGGGEWMVRLRGDAAPMMAARILGLVRRGYYDGLSWHRVEHDFVIQGGSPGASEYVGYRSFLRDELGMPHVRGTVGMSTRGHDTGDAQWFVNLKDNRRLDPDYTVFADVVRGMDVVDGIMEGDVIERMEVVRP